MTIESIQKCPSASSSGCGQAENQGPRTTARDRLPPPDCHVPGETSHRCVAAGDWEAVWRQTSHDRAAPGGQDRGGCGRPDKDLNRVLNKLTESLGTMNRAQSAVFHCWEAVFSAGSVGGMWIAVEESGGNTRSASIGHSRAADRERAVLYSPKRGLVFRSPARLSPEISTFPRCLLLLLVLYVFDLI